MANASEMDAGTGVSAAFSLVNQSRCSQKVSAANIGVTHSFGAGFRFA